MSCMNSELTNLDHESLEAPGMVIHDRASGIACNLTQAAADHGSQIGPRLPLQTEDNVQNHDGTKD